MLILYVSTVLTIEFGTFAGTVEKRSTCFGQRRKQKIEKTFVDPEIV